MELRLQGLHQLSVDMWKMIDELPAALEYTLSTTHHLYILSLPEQKIGQPHAAVGDGLGGDENGRWGRQVKKLLGAYLDELGWRGPQLSTLSCLLSPLCPYHGLWCGPNSYTIPSRRAWGGQGPVCFFNYSTISGGWTLSSQQPLTLCFNQPVGRPGC